VGTGATPGTFEQLRQELGAAERPVHYLAKLGKVPGLEMRGEQVELVACQRHDDEMRPYERLLGDALRGEHSLFTGEEPWSVP
jgi:glucose-6-phosphate 1-dehydrogenase